MKQGYLLCRNICRTSRKQHTLGKKVNKLFCIVLQQFNCNLYELGMIPSFWLFTGDNPVYKSHPSSPISVFVLSIFSLICCSIAISILVKKRQRNTGRKKWKLIYCTCFHIYPIRLFGGKPKTIDQNCISGVWKPMPLLFPC